MTLWNYINGKWNEILVSALVTSIGFLLAILLNSFIDNWKEEKVFLSTLDAIKRETASNEAILQDGFLKYYRDGLVLREFSITIASQSLVNPTFVKRASAEQLQILSEYVRELSLANAYRAKAETIRFSENYFIEQKKPTLKYWEKGLVTAWAENLSRCRDTIKNVTLLR